MGYWRKGQERARNIYRKIERSRVAEKCVFTDIAWTSGRRQTLPNQALPCTFSKVPRHTSSFHGLHIVSLQVAPKSVPVHPGRKTIPPRLRDQGVYFQRTCKNILSSRPFSHCLSELWNGMYSGTLTSNTNSIWSHGGRRGESTGYRGSHQTDILLTSTPCKCIAL